MPTPKVRESEGEEEIPQHTSFVTFNLSRLGLFSRLEVTTVSIEFIFRTSESVKDQDVTFPTVPFVNKSRTYYGLTVDSN